MRIYLDMKIDSIQRGWANHYLGHNLRRQNDTMKRIKCSKHTRKRKTSGRKVDGKNEGKKEVTA